MGSGVSIDEETIDGVNANRTCQPETSISLSLARFSRSAYTRPVDDGASTITLECALSNKCDSPIRPFAFDNGARS